MPRTRKTRTLAKYGGDNPQSLPFFVPRRQENAPSWCARGRAAKKTASVGARGAAAQRKRAELVRLGPTRRDFFANGPQPDQLAPFSL
ncbi:hypothetical protein, partial [Paratractidigestivibacter sp.]|uniref:hypothetical protein n=1 Tax=Paratractidigestivibacter sp. TaxID=2847316 RepID=UPI002AC95DCD